MARFLISNLGIFAIVYLPSYLPERNWWAPIMSKWMAGRSIRAGRKKIGGGEL